MGGGEILESGSHGELLLAGGLYATLVAGQQLAPAADKKVSEQTETTNFDDRDKDRLTRDETQNYAKKDKPELQKTTTGKLSLSILEKKAMGSSTAGEGVIPYRTIARRFWA